MKTNVKTPDFLAEAAPAAIVSPCHKDAEAPRVPTAAALVGRYAH